MNFYRYFRLLIAMLALCLGPLSSNAMGVKTQTIWFVDLWAPNAPEITTINSTHAVLAHATSGLRVTYSSLTPGVCTVEPYNATAPEGVVHGVSVGSCVIAANQAGDAIYGAATQMTREITMIKSSQVIIFGSAPTVVAGKTGTVTATATSGQPVTYSSTTPSFCSVSGSTVTGVTGGTCTIAANQAGDAMYGAATQVVQSITILTVPIISFGIAPKIVAGGTGTVSATTTSGLAVSFSSLTPRVCSVTGSTITGITVGTCTIAANRAGDATYGAATQVTQSITIAAPITNARVFAFAEANASSIFAGAPAAGQVTYQNRQFNYRYYPTSRNYLAIDSTGEIFVVGPYTGGALIDAGPAESLRTAITNWETAQASAAAATGSTGSVNCNAAWTGNSADIQVSTLCLTACSYQNEGNAAAKNSTCSILGAHGASATNSCSICSSSGSSSTSNTSVSTGSTTGSSTCPTTGTFYNWCANPSHTFLACQGPTSARCCNGGYYSGAFNSMSACTKRYGSGVWRY